MRSACVLVSLVAWVLDVSYATPAPTPWLPPAPTAVPIPRPSRPRRERLTARALARRACPTTAPRRQVRMMISTTRASSSVATLSVLVLAAVADYTSATGSCALRADTLWVSCSSYSSYCSSWFVYGGTYDGESRAEGRLREQPPVGGRALSTRRAGEQQQTRAWLPIPVARQSS